MVAGNNTVKSLQAELTLHLEALPDQLGEGAHLKRRSSSSGSSSERKANVSENAFAASATKGRLSSEKNCSVSEKHRCGVRKNRAEHARKLAIASLPERDKKYALR